MQDKRSVGRISYRDDDFRIGRFLLQCVDIIRKTTGLQGSSSDRQKGRVKRVEMEVTIISWIHLNDEYVS